MRLGIYGAGGQPVPGGFAWDRDSPCPAGTAGTALPEAAQRSTAVRRRHDDAASGLWSARMSARTAPARASASIAVLVTTRERDRFAEILRPHGSPLVPEPAGGDGEPDAKGQVRAAAGGLELDRLELSITRLLSRNPAGLTVECSMNPRTGTLQLPSVRYRRLSRRVQPRSSGKCAVRRRVRTEAVTRASARPRAP